MSTHLDTATGWSLVTGAGGFVGGHLTRRLLEQNKRVVALDLDLSQLASVAANENLELIEGDVTDEAVQSAALGGVDTVFHLAAAHLQRSAASSFFWRVNVDGSRSLAERALAAGVRRFVHCSSVGVYGRIKRPPADETTECAPELPYERSKLAGEKAVLEVAAAGLPTVILRPAWVYGPGCPRTERLFESIRRGRFVIGGRGQTLRHCIYIDDMVRAFLLAASREEAVGATLIVGDAGAVTVRHLVNETARLVGSRTPPRVPYTFLFMAAFLLEAAYRAVGEEPPLSRRSLRFFTGNTSFDTARAARLLGFRPEYNLQTGLRATYEALFSESLSQRSSDEQLQADTTSENGERSET